MTFSYLLFFSLLHIIRENKAGKFEVDKNGASRSHKSETNAAFTDELDMTMSNTEVSIYNRQYGITIYYIVMTYIVMPYLLYRYSK